MSGEQHPLPGVPGKVRRQPESVIVSEARDCLRRHGWLVLRHQAGLGTHPGLSDLEALRDGRTVYVECKTATGRLSVAQERFRDDVQAHGGRYIVCRGVDDLRDAGLVPDTVPVVRR